VTLADIRGDLHAHTRASDGRGSECSMPDAAGADEALYWHSLGDGRIQCDLSPRFCKLHEGQQDAASSARDGPIAWF